MVRDAYGLPLIDKMLDCLNGARIFTSVDLKSGYWQVNKDEASKLLMMFAISPLGFCECEHMPF